MWAILMCVIQSGKSKLSDFLSLMSQRLLDLLGGAGRQTSKFGARVNRVLMPPVIKYMFRSEPLIIYPLFVVFAKMPEPLSAAYVSFYLPFITQTLNPVVEEER